MAFMAALDACSAGERHPSMLEVRGLDKTFNTLTVAYQVSLNVPRGGRHAVIGPNGAGKTTLFNMICGAVAPDAGMIMIDDVDVTDMTPYARARAGLARSYQHNSLFPDMTVRENLAAARAVHGGAAAVFWRPFSDFGELLSDAEDLARRINVADHLDTPARHLSYGTQRQIEVGLALALEPKVLLLDEPTAGMSPEETREMQALIGGLPANLTIVIIEHDMDVVFDLAERVTVLDYGTVLLEGTPAEVRASDAVRQRYLGAARCE
jgi:branched-chain amino acid transport system ATP-binding protein